MNSSDLLLIMSLFLFSCQSNVEQRKNIYELDFINKVEDNTELNILSYLYFYNGAGVAVGDVVGNELPDIYLVSNQGENQLLENLGNLQFKNVTKTAGVAGKSDWQTGTAMVDINDDNLLDIFVASVNDIHGFKGHNEVYINQGDGTFLEQSQVLQLNQSDYSTAFSFLDYDLDGDLDIYLLNHAVHTEDGYRLKAEDVRKVISDDAGDRLLRNDHGRFTDVSLDAGIIRSKVSYGLAVKVADLNKDGWPDIYVSNDFHENDYIYMNQGDGTFLMQTKDLVSYCTKYSMGNDIADVNNDGWVDVFVADMEPWDQLVKKTTQGEDSPEIFAFKTNYGYTRQYTRNTLQINDRGQRFYDVAQQYGLNATDWSWSPILEDFNQDGLMDLFVSNGILRRPNDLDYLNYISAQEIQNQLKKGVGNELEIIKKMPNGLVPNQLMLQSVEGFEFKGEEVGFSMNDSSTGTSTGDFDGDGDLDLVINRVNAPSIIWQNNTTENNQSLKVSFYEPSKAYGTQLKLLTTNNKQYRELYPQRGFMSSSEPIIHFGIGEQKAKMRLAITWPNGTTEEQEIPVDTREITLKPSQNEVVLPKVRLLNTELHVEGFQSLEFSKDPLLPFKGFGKESISLTKKNIRLQSDSLSLSVNVQLDGVQVDQTLPTGLWQTAFVFDKDQDGDLDILLGNIGENNRLIASDEKPLRLYQADFDGNGVKEALWAIKADNGYIPLYDKDAIAKQLTYIKRNFPDYQSFAGKTMEEIFGEKAEMAEIIEIETLKSGWLIQENRQFYWEPLPFELQQGPITSIKEIDQVAYEVSGKLDIFVPYIGLLEQPKRVWKDGYWKNN